MGGQCRCHEVGDLNINVASRQIDHRLRMQKSIGKSPFSREICSLICPLSGRLSERMSSLLLEERQTKDDLF